MYKQLRVVQITSGLHCFFITPLAHLPPAKRRLPLQKQNCAQCPELTRPFRTQKVWLVRMCWLCARGFAAPRESSRSSGESVRLPLRTAAIFFQFSVDLQQTAPADSQGIQVMVKLSLSRPSQLSAGFTLNWHQGWAKSLL